MRFSSILFTVFLLPLVVATASCCSSGSVVQTYYDGLNAGDFNRVTSVVADSFTIIEGDFKTPLDRAGHYTMFQWDSVFVPTYEIRKLEALEEEVRVLVSSRSVRYAYLQNNPLTCEMTFSIADNKIEQLNIGECEEADWAKWEALRDSLVDWIDVHHTELSGFIHDLTKEGAEKYMKAITLYESRTE